MPFNVEKMLVEPLARGLDEMRASTHDRSAPAEETMTARYHSRDPEQPPPPPALPSVVPVLPSVVPVAPPNRFDPPRRRRQPAPRYVLAEQPDLGYREAGQSMEARRLACEWATSEAVRAGRFRRVLWLLGNAGVVASTAMGVLLATGAFWAATAVFAGVVALIVTATMAHAEMRVARSTCARLRALYGLALAGDPSTWTPPAAPSTNVQPRLAPLPVPTSVPPGPRPMATATPGGGRSEPR